ncbi:DUF6776 family protein [Acidovorax sp. SDU_ACID1]|uniref:DUF6776 family protein n=1 Tax=Acidovorax sp. SDU_ACID1 TaxID=3136632 RepID=UPI0038736BCE
MRFRLLRRRLTISAPRVAIRSAMPWPLRWLSAAVVLGLCGAVALWAFEFGKSIAGLDSGAREELQRLRAEVAQLREENHRFQDQGIAAKSLRTAEGVAMDRLSEQVRQLEADNRSLRDDLGFFEKLIPATKVGKALSIRGLHAEVLGDGAQLRWQVLAIQPMRNAPEFKGRLELVLAGSLDGAPWASQSPAVDQPVQFQQYRRMQGVVNLPARAMVKTVTARLLEGSSVRAIQTFTLE